MRANFFSMMVLSLFGVMCLTSLQPLTFHLSHAASPAIKRHALTRNHRSLTIHHNMRIFKRNHLTQLRHDATTEEYSLNDMGFYFSLNLTIGGLPYQLSIDTGSSDLFIKGENSPGIPKKKYSCPQCMENN
jgi:hypothetical protein